MRVIINVVLLLRCFFILLAVGSSWRLLSYTSKWSRDGEVHCVRCEQIISVLFWHPYWTFFLKEHFPILVYILFYIMIKSLILLFCVLFSILLCIFVHNYKYMYYCIKLVVLFKENEQCRNERRRAMWSTLGIQGRWDKKEYRISSITTRPRKSNRPRIVHAASWILIELVIALD